jgi:peptidoglycan glycosyltransferase
MNVKRGIYRLALLFLACFAALSVGLVYWQVVVAQQVVDNPHNGRKCLLDNAPVRGRIFDRNGVLLAYSTPSATGCGYVRHYTDPSLAGLIGYYAGPNYQATGIEAAYNSYLDGQVGMTALKNVINQTLHRPPVGDDIYLTIDERIQRIVNQDFDTPALIDNVNAFPSNRGAVIVTDPHTGEILAMLSRPSFDPNELVQQLATGNLSYYNQLVQNKDQPLLERPIQGSYVPGSTFKTMTLAAALDSGHTTLNQEFSQQQALGPVYFDGQAFGPVGNNIQGYTIHFPVTTEYGFAHSDNIIYAQIGVETGEQTWLNYAHSFYVGKQIPFDNLPVVVSHVRKNGQPLATNQLAADSFGQGFDTMTPLQMSLIDDAVANGGQMMQPQLIEKIVDPNHNVLVQMSPQPLGSQQISAQTAMDVRQAMYGVVRCGSGSLTPVKLYTSPWSIIAKTGTGQVSDTGTPAQAWLITQAPYYATNPAQLPSLTIVAMRENGGDGGQDVGPMVTAMYNDIFSQVIHVPQPAAPDPNYCCKTGLLQIGCA